MNLKNIINEFKIKYLIMKKIKSSKWLNPSPWPPDLYCLYGSKPNKIEIIITEKGDKRIVQIFPVMTGPNRPYTNITWSQDLALLRKFNNIDAEMELCKQISTDIDCGILNELLFDGKRVLA